MSDSLDLTLPQAVDQLAAAGLGPHHRLRVPQLARAPRDPSQAVVVPGTAIFLNRGGETTPLALRANVEHNHVRHAHVVIVSIDVDTIPRVAAEDRILVDALGTIHDGVTHVAIRFGYTETTDVPAVLDSLSPEQTEGPIDLAEATYFLSKIELRAGDAPGMARWRKRLFIATSHITADAAEHLSLPRDQVVLIGARTSKSESPRQTATLAAKTILERPFHGRCGYAGIRAPNYCQDSRRT